MKNLLIVMAILCVGMFGFSGTAFASAVEIDSLNCDTDGNDTVESDFCYDGDWYEATIKCKNLAASVGGDGLKIFDDGTFTVMVTDSGGTVIDSEQNFVEGETELKSTDALKGPNKTAGKSSHTGGDPEVKVEIEWHSDSCPD